MDNKLKNRVGFFDRDDFVREREREERRERERKGRPSGKNEVGTKVSREKRLG